MYNNQHNKYSRLIQALLIEGRSMSEIEDIIASVEERRASRARPTLAPKAVDEVFTHHKVRSVSEVVNGTKFPVVSIHYGDNILVPFFPFYSPEGPCVLIPSEPLLFKTWDEVKTRFPKERFYNINSDGQTRVEFSEYVQIPQFGPKVRFTSIHELTEYLHSGEPFPIHEMGKPVVPGVVSQATTIVEDLEDNVCYDLLKRQKSLIVNDCLQPDASVVTVSSVPLIDSFWITPDGLDDLLRVVPGKGYTILKVRDISVGEHVKFSSLVAEPPELDISLDTVAGLPPDVGMKMKSESTLSRVQSPEQVLFEMLQEYVDLVRCDESELDDTLNGIKLLIQFPKDMLPVIKEHEKSLAMTIGILIEEQVKTRYPTLSVPHGIFLLSQTPDNLILLLQAWGNRNYVAHGQSGNWYPLDYFSHDWKSFLHEPGPYGNLYHHRFKTSSRFIDDQVREWLFETGLAEYDSHTGAYVPGKVLRRSDSFIGFEDLETLILGLVSCHALPDLKIADLLDVSVDEVRSILEPRFCRVNGIAYSVSRFGVSYGPRGSRH